MARGFSGETGGMLEREQLGEVIDTKKYEHFRPLLEGRVSFLDKVRVVEQCQLQDSMRPRTYYGRELRKKIAALLDLDLEQDPTLVKFFVSVGTVLDKDGVDAFIRVKEPGTRFDGIVSIDITKNTNKDEWKANVISQFPKGSLDETNPAERRELDKIIETTANDVVEKVYELKERFFKGTPPRKAA